MPTEDPVDHHDEPQPDHRDAFARYPSGVTLLTTTDRTHQRQLVAASVLTASVRPYTLAVSVGSGRDALPALRGDGTWALGVLAAGHRPLVQLLTGPSSPEERGAALGRAGARSSPEGPLWLPDALVTFWCRTVSTSPVHDQVLVVGQVLRAGPVRAGRPLLRWDHSYRSLGEPLA